MGDNEKNIDPKTQELIDKFESSRSKLEVFAKEIEELKGKVGEMFPDTANYRNKWVLDEKIKTMSSFYDTLLKYRTAISKSIQDELEMRRKASEAKEMSDKDIRGLLDQIEEIPVEQMKQ